MHGFAAPDKEKLSNFGGSMTMLARAVLVSGWQR